MKPDSPQAHVPARVARRKARAARTRAHALSPLRILMRVLALPGLSLAVAVSVYVRTSPHDPQLALRHLVARAGCDAARSVGLAPAQEGEAGYHSRNDADGDGVACEPTPTRTVAAQVNQGPIEQGRSEAKTRYVGGAKFVRP